MKLTMMITQISLNHNNHKILDTWERW